MSEIFLKRAAPEAVPNRADLQSLVARHLATLEREGEAAARAMAQSLDGWDRPIVVPPEAVAEAGARLPVALKDAIRYAHDNIARFAAAQRASLCEVEVELRPGLWAGQRVIPVDAAGCYVPGGRYAHIASAMMSVTTARAAGVGHIAAVSPPRPEAPAGVPDAVLYTLDLCGADRILALGGIQGLAAMAFGLFGLRPADILVGPGNAFVAEAKRQLFGRVGIDMVAGPTDTMVLADATAAPERVAWDLVSQAEHGADSPVWLVTDHTELAREVALLVPRFIVQLPEPNRTAAAAAWEGLGEIVLCPDAEAMARHADARAPEHLHVQAADLNWWKARLRTYGSLFLGPEATVAFGDKAAGPNHVLPTGGAARYTGGLSVHKFLKTTTWQRVTAPALTELAEATAIISRHEGMEAHARAAELRLAVVAEGRAG